MPEILIPTLFLVGVYHTLDVPRINVLEDRQPAGSPDTGNGTVSDTDSVPGAALGTKLLEDSIPIPSRLFAHAPRGRVPTSADSPTALDLKEPVEPSLAPRSQNALRQRSQWGCRNESGTSPQKCHIRRRGGRRRGLRWSGHRGKCNDVTPATQRNLLRRMV